MNGNARWKELVVAGSIALGLLAVAPRTARAHCDTLDGPVVVEAKAALGKGDVTPVLKWVKEDAENEIRAAFEKTLKVRDKGEDARELADLWFFGTLVRVHRAGEGAPYTGLKPAGTPVAPAVVKADEALVKGSVDDLAQRMGEHAAAGVRGRFNRAAEAKKHMNDSVEAGREYVEAYVTYVHYVENLHGAVVGQGGHHAEVAEGTPAHAHPEE
jgi:hypothetical protein